MPRIGNGTYELPAGNPVVPFTTIESTWANGTCNDLAAALTNSIATDGQTVPIANLTMGGFRLKNTGNATVEGDAVNAKQVQGERFNVLTSVAGTADQYTAALALNTVIFTPGMHLVLFPPVTNNAGVTIVINGVPPTVLHDSLGLPLAAGVLLAGVPYNLQYDGLFWRVVGVGGVVVGNTIAIEDEGILVAIATTLNVTGAGATATDAGGGVVNLDIPGGAGPTALNVQDEGVPVVTTGTVNFTGAGVTATNVAGVATVTIPGGASVGGVNTEVFGTPVLTPATTLNFVGNVNVIDSGGGKAEVIIFNPPPVQIDVAYNGTSVNPNTTQISFTGPCVVADLGAGITQVALDPPPVPNPPVFRGQLLADMNLQASQVFHNEHVILTDILVDNMGWYTSGFYVPQLAGWYNVSFNGNYKGAASNIPGVSFREMIAREASAVRGIAYHTTYNNTVEAILPASGLVYCDGVSSTIALYADHAGSVDGITPCFLSHDSGGTFMCINYVGPGLPP